MLYTWLYWREEIKKRIFLVIDSTVFVCFLFNRKKNKRERDYLITTKKDRIKETKLLKSTLRCGCIVCCS